MYAIKTVDKAEIIRGDDIDITMAERRILTMGTKNNFLTQLHSSFQVVIKFHHPGGCIETLYLEQGEAVLRDGIPPGRRPHVPPHEGREVHPAPEPALRRRDRPGVDVSPQQQRHLQVSKTTQQQ